MLLIDELRTTAESKKSLVQFVLSAKDAEAVVMETLPRQQDAWIGTMRAVAGGGKRRVALSYGVLGEELTPFLRRELERFLKSNKFSFEEGRAHHVTASEGEWRVEGYFVVKW